MMHTAQPQRSRTATILQTVNLALITAVVISAALLSAQPMQAQTFKALHYFQGADGSKPCSRLTGDANGHLYGTTASGGKGGVGTVYEVKIATGRVTVLHDFTNRRDGRYPCGDLLRGVTGNLYGMNRVVLFKLDRNRLLTPLVKLSVYREGLGMSGLVADPAGNLYGTTSKGGLHGQGEVFKLDPSGGTTALYGFSLEGGLSPHGGLVLDAGYLYGVARDGGEFGQGTVYRVGVTGTGEEVLHSFNVIDGSSPQAGLVRDTAGNLYGTTTGGGAFHYGTVFKLDPSWNLTTLYSFVGGDDGWWPSTALVLDPAGNLYGTTRNGGPEDYGTLFKLDPAGVKTTLHNFAPQEGLPVTSLYMDAAGVLYGTSFNKAWNDGMIYSLIP